MSVWIVCGSAQAIHGRRMNPDSESIWLFMSSSSFCSRSSRVRSVSRGLHWLMRVRANASAWAPSRWWVPDCSRSVKPPLRKPPLMNETTQLPV